MRKQIRCAATLHGPDEFIFAIGNQKFPGALTRSHRSSSPGMFCALPVTLKPLLPVTKFDGGELIVTLARCRYPYNALADGITIAVRSAMTARKPLILSALVHFSFQRLDVALIGRGVGPPLVSLVAIRSVHN
jgi:hypothetical protein